MTRVRRALVWVCVAVGAMGGVAEASWSAVSEPTEATAQARVLQPPSGLSAETRCVIVLVLPRAEITWQPSPSAFTTGYEILRSTTPGGPYTRLTDVDAPTTTFVDGISLIGGESYYYVVRATAGNWRSAPTSEAGVTLPTLVCPLF